MRVSDRPPDLQEDSLYLRIGHRMQLSVASWHPFSDPLEAPVRAPCSSQSCESCCPYSSCCPLKLLQGLGRGYFQGHMTFSDVFGTLAVDISFAQGCLKEENQTTPENQKKTNVLG